MLWFAFIDWCWWMLFCLGFVFFLLFLVSYLCWLFHQWAIGMVVVMWFIGVCWLFLVCLLGQIEEAGLRGVCWCLWTHFLYFIIHLFIFIYFSVWDFFFIWMVVQIQPYYSLQVCFRVVKLLYGGGKFFRKSSVEEEMVILWRVMEIINQAFFSMRC